jgi:2'-5' RNA ligase
MSRYFFALWPNSEIRDAIIDQSSYLALSGSGTIKANLHITLVFLGKLNIQQVQQIIKHAEQVSCSAFDICLNHSGYFKKSKASWLGLESTPVPLLYLQQQLIQVTEQCTIAIKAQKYKPHLTLSRKTSVLNRQLINPILWSINNYALIKSIDTDKGVIYQPVKYFSCN